ncbi:hypothetical protein [Streptomyces yangpuensis]|uniref:hypothetical protein n=1 Tax=Streptomyces yangpuensis TaxID=1648182 RepID=UPI00365A326E
METVVLIAVIILMIGIGMRWIHLLNPSTPHGSRPTASVTPCRGPRPAGRHRSVVEPTTRVPTGEERTALLTRPEGNRAHVKDIAHTPEAARAVAEALRRCFAGAEQRSYPALDGNTRLHLTVDRATPAGFGRSWPAAIRPSVGTGAHSDEI